MDPALLRIGAVARATGMAVSTLRSWETRYGLPIPERTSGGHRLYATSAVDQVHEVLALVGNGASTAAAAALVLTQSEVPVRPDPPRTPPTALGPSQLAPSPLAPSPLAPRPPAPLGSALHSAVPLQELLLRTRAAKAESHRLRAELTTATAAASASLGALQDMARQLHAR